MSEMNPIYKIYQNQLQRIPDPDGLRHYQAQMAGGRTLEDIRREIANSPEAKNRGVGAFAPVPTYTAIPPKDYMDRSRPSFMQEGVPRGGRGYAQGRDAIRAAEKARGDLFEDGYLKPGYSYTGGEGRVLLDSIAYGGGHQYDGGTLNIFGPANPVQVVEQQPEQKEAATNTGEVDPGGPITGGSSEGTNTFSVEDAMRDVMNAIANMQAPTINIPAAPAYSPPPSFAAVGHAGSDTPGVKIRRSRSRSLGTNTLGTSMFNRGTRNTLRINSLNI